MFTAARVRRRGFTLIELLVVVAIIALLISILLPSLGRAREQGKTAKCLANLRGIMNATHIYFIENNDAYPYMTTENGICSWNYGGKTSDDYWKSQGFFVDQKDKPFNRIMLGQKPEEDRITGGKRSRVEFPNFKCPSDSQTAQRGFQNGQNPPISAYDDVGTSYHFNLYFFVDMRNRKGKNLNTFEDWAINQKQAIRDTRGAVPGRFVMYWEDPMDYALYKQALRLGFHKAFSRHSVGFLDGHAENKYMDTRSFGGVGWTALNRSWIETPDNKPEPYYFPVSGGYSKRNEEPPK